MTKIEMRMALKAYNNYGLACTKDYVYSVHPYDDPETGEVMISMHKRPTWCGGNVSLANKYMQESTISLKDLINSSIK